MFFVLFGMFVIQSPGALVSNVILLIVRHKNDLKTFVSNENPGTIIVTIGGCVNGNSGNVHYACTYAFVCMCMHVPKFGNVYICVMICM